MNAPDFNNVYTCLRLDIASKHLVSLLEEVQSEERPSAIIHSRGRVVAANNAWVGLCDDTGENVVRRNVAKGWMYRGTKQMLEHRYRVEGSFEARYSAFWSPKKCFSVVNKMRRIETSPGIWYGINTLVSWREVEPILIVFGE